MGEKELILTSKGLHFVNWDRSDEDFKFLFGSEVCGVHSLLAEFLSPKVADLRKMDPFCDIYTISDACSDCIDSFNNLVSSLLGGQAVRVSSSNHSALLKLSHELGNIELFSLLLDMIDRESLKITEAVDLLNIEIALGIAFTDRFGNLTDFVASHFYEIPQETINELDLETIARLLQSSSLKIKDEDSLYNFVRSRSEERDKQGHWTLTTFACLFEFIHFEYLSVEAIEDFAGFVTDHLPECINAGIWTQICRRLTLRTQKKNPRDVTPANREFAFDGSNFFGGILNHLTQKCGGNVHDKGVVNITASSVFQQNWAGAHPSNLVDYGSDAIYHSERDPNAYFCIDFYHRRVIPKGYSLKSYSWQIGHHLRYWVLECSNDGKNWLQVDCRQNNYDLNGSHISRHFAISTPPSTGFRFVRLRKIGPDHRNDNYLILNSFEIFGTLCEEVQEPLQ